MTQQAMSFVRTLPPEEQARANFYALLARLLYAPPDAALLEGLAGAGEIEAEEGDMAAAWRSLVLAAVQYDAAAVRDEYDTVFIGTGKAPVTLYAGAYTTRYSNEVPLAELRGELARLGLARRDGVSEPEDHIAALFDVMRHLIASRNDLPQQKVFFERWIWPAATPLCNAIQQCDKSAFYKAVAAFCLGLCTLEHTQFEML